MNEIKFIDLFGGIGGFRLGLEKASKRFKCVWYCDKDKYAVETYNKNFKENYQPTDITTVNTKSIPEFDMLTGGFPCQSFSIAGKRKGFQDIRGTMFFQIYRIAQEKRPRLLFLENVKGLLSADDGRCFSTIISSLDELGYDVEWQVLNSKNFGVPQNRERVFIIGHLRGTSPGQVFPLRKYHKENEREVGIIREQFDISGKGYNSQQDRVYHTDGVMCCLPNAHPDNKLNIMINLHQWRTGEYGNGIKEDESFTLDQGCGRDYVMPIGNKIRRLTQVECERLQGFPDGWTEGISDTQRYKQLGNAVTVNVIQAIGEAI